MRRAYSILGLLITMACVVVLFAVLMTGLNRAVTGEGSAQGGTVRSVRDQMNLHAIMQGMIVYAGDHDGWFPVPSEIDGSGDPARNTTANLFSALVALRYATPEQLVAANEFSGYVEVDHDYDYTAFHPAENTYWDPGFRADLDDLANVSWAHLPLAGARAERGWRSTLDGAMPVLGSRGPKDGVEDTASFTYGRNGRWGGHVAYGDGHVAFIESFTPAGIVRDTDGGLVPDNVFAMEDGPLGADIVLAFTREMTEAGPMLQWD